jgi:hypothetical protein
MHTAYGPWHYNYHTTYWYRACNYYGFGYGPSHFYVIYYPSDPTYYYCYYPGNPVDTAAYYWCRCYSPMSPSYDPWQFSSCLHYPTVATAGPTFSGFANNSTSGTPVMFPGNNNGFAQEPMTPLDSTTLPPTALPATPTPIFFGDLPLG